MVYPLGLLDFDEVRVLRVSLRQGVGRGEVSVLMQPPLSTLFPDMSASCQAPWPIDTTPGMMRGVTFATISTVPRSLNT